ncbi:MAG: hypothetical protein Kow0062_07070 [Acidobacteriota bacterium]
MRPRRTSILLSALTIALFVSGYVFLRYAYRVADGMPFSQEIVLIVLGTLATVLITALLLNRQTEVELHKEQSIKFLELKSETYRQLIDGIEELLVGRTLGREEGLRLQFLAHRLAIVASPPVLEEFERFLETLDAPAARGRIDEADAERISRALAVLSVRIRADLVGELDAQQHEYTPTQIARQISENIDEAMDR